MDEHREKFGTISLLPPPPGLARWGRNEWEQKAVLLHLRSAKYRCKRGAPKQVLISFPGEIYMSWQVYVQLSLMMFLQFAVWGAWSPVLASRLLGPLKMSGKQTGWGKIIVALQWGSSM